MAAAVIFVHGSVGVAVVDGVVELAQSGDARSDGTDVLRHCVNIDLVAQLGELPALDSDGEHNDEVERVSDAVQAGIDGEGPAPCAPEGPGVLAALDGLGNDSVGMRVHSKLEISCESWLEGRRHCCHGLSCG